MKVATAAPPSLPPVQADVDALGDRIAELAAHIQAATYRLLVLIHEFDERSGWHAHGARSCAHWLSWRTGLDLGAAREKVRVARALAGLPRLSRAMRAGEVSYSKVRAITRVATAENEEELLVFAKAGTAAHVERLVRAWRLADRCEEFDEDERRLRHRRLETYTDEDGMLVVRGRLLPEAGAVLLRALDAAGERIYAESKMAEGAEVESLEGDEPTYAQKRADALALLAESALGGGLDEAAGGGERFQVVVHVDAEALGVGSERGQAALEDGVRVSAETSRRLACEASRVMMRHGRGGETLDVGRKTRAVPPALRRALSFRDRGCRFPGCGVRICDAHHVEHWADGGKTSLDNLLLLCRRHHRAVHEEGYRVLLRADGRATFYSAGGRRIPGVPEPVELGGEPVSALRHENEIRVLGIGPETGMAGWDGTVLDLALAVEGLRSQALATRTADSGGSTWTTSARS